MGSARAADRRKIRLPWPGARGEFERSWNNIMLRTHSLKDCVCMNIHNFYYLL